MILLDLVVYDPNAVGRSQFLSVLMLRRLCQFQGLQETFLFFIIGFDYLIELLVSGYDY